MQGIARADGDAVLTGEVRFLQGAGETHQAVPRRLEAPGRTLADLAADAARRALRARRPARTRADVGRRPRRRPLARDALRAQHDAGGRGPRPRRARWPRACSPRTRSSGSRAGASSRRWRRRRPRASTPSRCSRPTPTTRCSARRSCCPTTRSWRPRAAATSSTAPRSRRRCCCTSSPSPTTSARRSPPPTRPCARWSPAPPPRRPRTSSPCTGATVLSDPAPPHAEPPGREAGRGRRRHLPPRRQGRAAPRATAPTPTTGSSTAGSPRVERIYFDYDDKLYFGVTVDDDPGQELMRDTGRFLFFFTGELEVCPT